MTLTFGNWQKTNQNQGVFVSSPNVVVNISDREVDRVVFMLAGCDRGCRLIASKDYRDKHCAMRINVCSDEVLSG